jgi:hypothetical protein
VRELSAGADIEIEDHFTAEDELPYRSVVDVGPSRTQLGWTPNQDVRSGVRDFVERQRAFIAVGAHA